MARRRQGNPTGVRKATVAGEAGHRRRPTALTLLAVTQFLVVLDEAIVNIALPSIGSALALSQEGLSLVVNAYVLTFGGFLLLGGRTADLLGRRRVFMTGLVVFAAASLAGGLAQSGGQLIAARALQGLGAAIISPAALSIVVATFAEGPERSRAMGVLRISSQGNACETGEQSQGHRSARRVDHRGWADSAMRCPLASSGRRCKNWPDAPCA